MKLFTFKTIAVLSIASFSNIAFAAGDFSGSCTNATVSGSTLSATCKKMDGSSSDTQINLNDHIVNTDGALDWAENGKFMGSCSNTNLDGSTLKASCKKMDQSTNNTSINLDAHIANMDGVLTFQK